MTMKPISIVTGGAGFIGSHMVDLLRDQGHRVRVIDDFTGGHEKNLAHRKDDPDLEVARKSILDVAPDDPLFEGVKWVFHFAGIGDIVPSIQAPAEYMNVNVQGTVRILEAARHAGVEKMVYAASSSGFGLAETPTPEDHVIQPQYPYALSKNLGEQACMHWHKVYGLPVNSIRIFNAYGPRVRTTGAYGAVFGVFLKQKLESKPFTVVGDGSQTRDFIFVTDVSRAFLAAADTPLSGESWNIGAGKPESINRLVELLGGPVVYIPKRPGEPDCTWADIRKISRDLNWAPTVSFEDGVKIMLDSIEHWRDAPLWDPESIRDATKEWFEYLS